MAVKTAPDGAVFSELMWLCVDKVLFNTLHSRRNETMELLTENPGTDIIMTDILGFATAFRFSPHFTKWSPGPKSDMSCPRLVRQGTTESIGRAPACFTERVKKRGHRLPGSMLKKESFREYGRAFFNEYCQRPSTLWTAFEWYICFANMICCLRQHDIFGKAEYDISGWSRMF